MRVDSTPALVFLFRDTACFSAVVGDNGGHIFGGDGFRDQESREIDGKSAYIRAYHYQVFLFQKQGARRCGPKQPQDGGHYSVALFVIREREKYVARFWG